MVAEEVVKGFYLILYKSRFYISGRDKRIKEAGAFYTYLSNSSTILSS